MRTLATNISTTVTLGKQDTIECQQLLKNGWEWSQSFSYQSKSLGLIEFQVLVRVVHFHTSGPQIAETVLQS